MLPAMFASREGRGVSSCRMNLIFRDHALQRMFERGISVEDIEFVLAEGELVEDYPDDFPLPSRLLLGFVDERPIHLVVASDASEQASVIITVYTPSLDRWQSDFKERKT